VVAYCVDFLLQNGIGALSVVHHRHIVAINICGAVNSNPHHPQLVTETSCGFYNILHCNTFSAKHNLLHSRLSLGEPHNGCHVQIDDTTFPRAAREVLSCMIRIHKETEVNFISSCDRSIWRDCLLDVPIHGLSIDLDKSMHINVGISRIK
jgi:hypothetical protein